LPRLVELTTPAQQSGWSAAKASAELWSTVGGGLNATDMLDALLELLPPSIEKWGLAAAALAADWYENQRAENEVRGRFSAVVPDLGDTGAEELARWGVDPMFSATPDEAATRSRVDGGLQRRIANHSRQTIMQSSIADPKARGWQRVTDGAGCGFCTMLASRGFVYTEASVDFASHDYCNCNCVAAWSGDRKPVKAWIPHESEVSAKDQARTRDWVKKNMAAEERAHHQRAREKAGSGLP
jgi:hypothetical protein